MTDYSQHTRTRNTLTPQGKPITGREAEMVPNSAGGFVFQLDHWKQLQRFLILGSEGGTYYVGEKDLTKDNHANLMACVGEDSNKVLDLIYDVSVQNRAPKNEPAIYALAVVAAQAKDVAARQRAFAILQGICRIGTHLFSFAQYYTAFRGWSRMSRSGIAGWYTDRSLKSLTQQLLKYKERNGWAHRDLIRLSHVTPKDQPQRELLKWAVNGELPISDFPEATRVRRLESLHGEGVTTGEVITAITEHAATFEMIPTQFLKEPEVWKALLPHMGAHALMRNLGRISSLGMLQEFSTVKDLVGTKLNDHEWMKDNRVHPLNLMVTIAAYNQGHGLKGKLSWSPDMRVRLALEHALEASFKWVEPTNKRLLIALDVSGSMGSEVAGMTGVSCRMAECVMALMYVRNEPFAEVVAFDQFIVPLPFGYDTSLTDAIKIASHWQGGRTDLSAPIMHMLHKKVSVDAFVMFTDNETWAGHGHPVEWLRRYREAVNPEAKLIVCGMTSTGFSIADPSDPRTLDIVGMDTSVPAVIASVLTA